MTNEEYFCPQCGQRLFSHNCKIKCSRCGYTEDCADALLVDYERQNLRPKRTPDKRKKDTVSA
jgi:uncharacterized Zn finger protein (UPF0148 family)